MSKTGAEHMVRGRRITFYADKADLTKLFADFVRLGEFSYTLNYWDEGQPIPTVGDPADIPDYGVLSRPLPSICDLAYLVIDASDALRPERYTLKAGGARFTVDNSTNPSSVMLCLGGDAGDRTLIASQIDTLGLTERARQMHAAFSRIVRKRSTKVGICYVLPEAMSKFKDGWRLTYGKGYAPSQDLKLPA
jgi:hypothetical protein